MREISCSVMRGGTSRGLFFKDSDLPKDPELRDRVCCSAFGGPDPYGTQINGLGGPIGNMNKLAIISKREGETNSVNYEFGQIAVKSWVIGKRANCGNISSAVGPYAIEAGFIDVIEEPFTTVRIYNTNTKKFIVEKVPVKNGKVVYDGDFSIAGCPGTGSKLQLDFIEPGGATTGRLLPTGKVKETIHTRDFGDFEVSIIDAANPFVFVRAEDLGFTGTETGTEITNSGNPVEKLMQIRETACVMLGWAKDIDDARRNSPGMPKACFVAPPTPFKTPLGEELRAEDYDIAVRMIEFGTGLDIMALTGCVCVGVASKIKGSVVWETLSEKAHNRNELVLAHPSGLVPVGMDVTFDNGEYRANSGTIYRTARKLMSGTIYVNE